VVRTNGAKRNSGGLPLLDGEDTERYRGIEREWRTLDTRQGLCGSSHGSYRTRFGQNRHLAIGNGRDPADIKVPVLGTNLAEINWQWTRKDYGVVLNRYLASKVDLIAALRWSLSVLWRPCEGGEREDDDLVSLSWE
jgi:hypothetical protein